MMERSYRGLDWDNDGCLPKDLEAPLPPAAIPSVAWLGSMLYLFLMLLPTMSPVKFCPSHLASRKVQT